MILEQMLAIVMARIKLIKLKNSLRSLSDLRATGKSPEKFKDKIHNLKTVAFLIANICDQIDIYAAPSNDPRINSKLKSNSAQNTVLDILDKFLKMIEESMISDPTSVHKYFLKPEKAGECLQRITEIADQNHFDSRKREQRLNLNFLYSFIQAKYALTLNSRPSPSLYQHQFAALRRSLEIAQVNKNINGVLEAFRKLIQGSLELAIKLKYKKSSL